MVYHDCFFMSGAPGYDLSKDKCTVGALAIISAG